MAESLGMPHDFLPLSVSRVPIFSRRRSKEKVVLGIKLS